jgi:hypothetical protein
MRRTLSLLACVSLLAALPAAAEVYTIKLTNGTTFESRYQPKQAAWDTTMVTFLDETGLEIALPRALVADVTAQSELKGYGRVIDTTTIDLGIAPNDYDETRQMQTQADVSPFEEAMNRSYDQQQFVEPGEAGGGIPVGFGGYGGGGDFGGGGPVFTPPPPPVPAPAPAPAPAAPPPQQ